MTTLPSAAPSAAKGFGELLLQHRWKIAMMVGVVAIAIEVIEHRPDDLQHLDPDFLPEILLFGIAFPLMSGLSLTKLAHTRSDEMDRQLKWRWLAITLAAFVIIAIEVVTHRLDGSPDNDFELVPEILAFGPQAVFFFYGAPVNLLKG